MKRKLSIGGATGRRPAPGTNRPYKMVKCDDATGSPQIQLAPNELQLTTLLREACATKGTFTAGDAGQEAEGLVVRYAGGWVRDKILGKPSHDIDIAVSTLSGHEFATQFAAYLTANHPELKTGSIAKILANPEKSKHLDTATARFGTLECDFVQLRTESYAGSGETRTPSHTGVGTLEEDAERRDCTMNALYYNVHTMTVEDPTRRGLEDLKNGLIRTPLEPRQTFLDDPLRVLRCLRFASQFAFEIDQQTFDTMQSQEVLDALQKKVVRERIGIEVHKAMIGVDPARAIRALHSRGLYPVVFGALPVVEPSSEDGTNPAQDWFTPVSTALELLHDTTTLAKFETIPNDGRLWLSIALLPYAHDLLPPGKNGKQETRIAGIVRDSLKLPTTMVSHLKTIYPPAETVSRGGVLSDVRVVEGELAIVLDNESEDGIRQFAADDTVRRTRVSLARMVRQLGANWPISLFVACHLGRYNDSTSSTALSGIDAFSYLHRLLTVNHPDLALAHAQKPRLDGKTVKSKVLDVVGCKDVTVMRLVIERSVLITCADPAITDDDLIDMLKRYLQTDLMKTART